MRRIFVLTWAISLATMTATPGFAADPYTYRAGQAYMKAAATDHNQCEAQCQGDAACRGWNFIRPNPRSRSGICEFNARKAVPQASPVSISGEINTGVDPLMSHAVPMSGNTVRVGTPIIAKRETPKLRIDRRQMAAAPMPNKQQRLVKRMPVPGAEKTPVRADYKRTIPGAPADVRTPRIYGGDTPKAQPNMQPRQQTRPAQQLQPRQMQPRQMTRQQIYREQMLAAQKRVAEQNQMQAQIQMQRRAAARMPQQFAPRQQTPAAPMQNPYAQPMPPQSPMQPQMQAAPPAPIPPQNLADRQSLYGSLHDDLTQNMTPVPRPQTAPDQAANPDAPLSTSRAVPAKPVEAEPLGYPAIPGLAGG